MEIDKPLTVLTIEDDPVDAKLVRQYLAKLGLRCEVLHRDRLSAGLARLAEGGIDLVLLDFSLPDSQGLASFRALHSQHPDVPVIVLTGMDDDELATRAVAEGAQDYLIKREVDAPLLGRAIRYALERHRAEAALRCSEERYALAVRGANDGIWDWDVGRGAVYLSPRWKEMLGLDEEELDDQPSSWRSLIAPEDLDTFHSALEAAAAAGEEHFELEHRMVCSGGAQLWVLTRGILVRDPVGRVVRIVGSMTDISARKRAEESLIYDAFHDGLTGLANRSLFLDRLGVALAALRRSPNQRFAVLFLDLDRFKTVNDSLGHGVGDRLLVAIARRIEELTRPIDTVARLGGDEFALIAGRVADSAGAAHIAERLQVGLAEPFLIGDHEVYVTASIGIALPDEETADAERLLRDADLAMYRAKAAGRGCYEVFDLELHHAAVALLKLETELRRAVAVGDFVMHYQPIVALPTGAIVGFEALTRWRHPVRGLVSPAHFIGLAEETGLVVPLGWLVLENACRQAREWQQSYPQDPPLFMSVNVSGKLFAQDGAVEQVLAILEQSQLSPESLRLEVTESVVLDHGEEVMERLRLLRQLGVQLSIDDFGTGYSSLSYLQRFRYDELKIDRSFVGNLAFEDSRVIVETILQLASHLGIGVVAEGVETAEQLEHLRQLGCPLAQGFWFAKPLDAAGAGALLGAGMALPN
ncbi:MAG TPA: EAL domain-containing protein [Thermoanaerobaculia bacterium]|nr:EAL domain-containing protein [Thermoanaerobaculia bacterium]